MSDYENATEFTVRPANSGAKKATGLVIAVIVAVLVIIAALNTFTIVNEGYIGVKYRFGRIVSSEIRAGLNAKIPFVENITQIDIRNQIYEVTTDAYTSDTQTVGELQLKLNYYYDQGKLSEIIRETGINNVEARLLVPNVAKIAKNEIGKVKAEVLVQSRAAVQGAIQESLAGVLEPYGIIVSEFALQNLKFDNAFEASIQAKVIAAQDALKMANKTTEREEEAKQIRIAAQANADSALIKAEAEAKAIKLLQEQISSNPNYIEYLKITNWNGTLPQVIGDGVNPFVVLGDVSTAVKPAGSAASPAASDTTD
ncbi:serine protease [Clostridia bacterium]|nr:serine protease [Clostridia bacterium]